MPEIKIVLRSPALGEWVTRIDADDEADALDKYLARMGERGVTRTSATSARFLDEVFVTAERARLRIVPKDPVTA